MSDSTAQKTTAFGEPPSAGGAGSTLALERRGIAHVPTNQRYGNPRNQFTVRFAPVIYLAGIYLGASGGPLGLGFTGSVTAIVLANILGSIVTGLCAVMGPRLGMPQLPMGRAAFGYVGNFLPAFLTLLMCIGYYSVGTVLGAKSLADLLNAPYAPTVVVVAAVSILIGIFGYKILHTMGKIITNLSIVVLTVVSVVLIVHGGGPGTEATVSGANYWLAWSVLFTAVFGYTASWAPYASDYSRYLPQDSKPSSIFTAATAGLFASTTWMMCLGAGLITLMPDGDVLDTFGIALPDWLRYVVLLTLGLSAIPHNSVNLYSGAMNTLTCDVKLPQWVTVTIAGVIGMVVALVFGGDQFQSNFLLFLHVLSYYITPWVAVLLVDYYVVQRAGRNTLAVENFYTRTGAFGRFNTAGLAALIVGVIVSVPFMANDFYTGPIGADLAGADLSYFVSAIVAAVIYLIARRASSSSPAGRVRR
ncbi:cytosine permease [Mycobacterium sp. 21AC1]|uniref:purine-cytosine permease family protein n=1 Tax=[Mycobacterium] appelbergii TaxID=2939269 RepID=UPI00293938B7|nr:cytosine permease [Mycobacterium sp. 21AC1]MDV3123615.1 cytosine permease [Mycobacterium sp. 21AC1]